MKKEEKAKVIDRLQDALSRSRLVVAADYRGLTAAEMTQLRRQLGEGKVEFHVVKNTLTLLAGARAGKEGLEPLLEGPTAMAFGYQDEFAPARILANYIRITRSNLRIKGGLLGQRVLTPADVQSLATLPPREVLLSRALGQMKAPLAALVGVLSSPLQGFLGVLQARQQQLEAAQG